MINFQNDKELFSFIKEHLYVAAVCDILDELGYRNQAMHQRLRPLLPGYEKLWIYWKSQDIKVDGNRSFSGKSLRT